MHRTLIEFQIKFTFFFVLSNPAALATVHFYVISECSLSTLANTHMALASFPLLKTSGSLHPGPCASFCPNPDYL